MSELLKTPQQDNEVYNPDQTEIHSFSREIAGRVSKRDMLEFIKIACETDADDAEQFLVSKIANAYGLKNVPYVVHLDADDVGPAISDKAGGFDRHNGIITLYFGKGRIDSFCEHVEMLSHELWHAKQYEAISDGEERGKLYEKNLDHYIKPQMDAEGYERQIIEAEAYDIGRRLSMRYISVQYALLDADDLAELRALKTKYDFHDISDMERALSDGKINRDDFWLLYFDFRLSDSTN